MVHAAVRKRSVVQSLTLPLYLAGLVFVLAFDPDYHGTQERVFDVGMTINMGLGFVHAVAIRSWVFGTKDENVLRGKQRAALRAHADLVDARRAARRLAADKPQLARELGVGRPDLPGRSYPDGGLVDVNHVSADVLTEYAGVPAGLAARIVELRDRVGSFSSLEDLMLFLDQDQADLGAYADVLVFVPR